MKTVERIIEQHGGMEALKEKAITLQNEPFMPLHVEHVGTGPRGFDLVAVSHTFELNGDIMRDPEIVFEVPPQELERGWGPVEITQHPMGRYEQAVWKDADTGNVMIRPRLVVELKQFARMWDRNLKHQGYARIQPSEGGPGA